MYIYIWVEMVTLIYTEMELDMLINLSVFVNRNWNL